MSQANMSINPFAQLGRATLALLRGFGKATLFLIHSVVHMFSRPWQWRRVIEQLYFIGAKSIVVICVTGLFTGMVLGLQGYYTLSKFGSTGLLGSAVALTLIRELGPVLTAIMIIGRAGSAMTAEIGIMRISEQIDALKTMTIDPIRFLVSPRIIAALISFPLLTAIFDTVGIFGGYLTGSQLLGINPATYFYRVESSVIMADVAGGFIKSMFFSITVITVCCYHGYYTHIRRDNFGAKGVGLSTTTAVVQASILVLVIDYILTTFLL